MTKFISFQDILLNQVQVPVRLLDKYTTLGLNEQEVMVILQLLRFLQENNDFPTPNDLANHLTISEKDCANILRKLIQKNFLSIEQLENEENRITEKYSLNPLWKKLFTEETEEQTQEDGTIFILFEQEFGRPLSPFEIEMINSWLDEDKIEPSLIKAGLRESVLMGKLNFKYIDRILREWQKKGIHSVEQARKASKAFHENQSAKQHESGGQKRDTSIYYNWLEEE
ncbi:DnaD domain-containing protein [Lentibacillus amyloliquefaciens]|uniref:DNA replication protein DnaD n=1 Tax=Lentibacillus amyloliquefaciens TaxID=1472767 RepID=A0A0U3WDS9_9BACI|nr:DnaD domain-containing protein [Lentibacillus amyloliquefaciens]ALX47935.1 DNA replication protein DnaD [Lentibacillus amyloliquefaciens]